MNTDNKNTETKQCTIPSVMHRALQWWKNLPDHGAKNTTFNECRFETKGGLTNVYHYGKFCTDLTDDEIMKIYELHGA